MTSEAQTETENKADGDTAERASSGASVAPVKNAIKVGPVDEATIEAPSKQTLFILGVVSITTLIMWGAGRAACNYFVPGESLTPRSVTLEERTFHPKDVGLEFALAVAGGRFADAEKLSSGEALAFVKSEEKSCGECSTRKKVANSLLAVPVVTKANPIAGFVRVTVSGAGTNSTSVLLVERSDSSFKVTRVFGPNDALPALPEPPPPPTPMGQGPLLPPSGK